MNEPAPKQLTLNRFDPRSWSLATQMALASGFLVAIILGAAAWMVTVTAGPTVIERGGGTFQAVASGLNDVMVLYFSEKASEIQVLAQSDVLRAQIEAKNAGYPGSAAQINARLQTLDQSWLTASADHPLVIQVTDPRSNPAAGALQDFLAGFPEHSEVFITDRYGGTVAASGRLSDYYQADEQWWQAAWNNGRGAIFLSQPIFDESAGVLAVQLAVPVLDAEGDSIGVARATLATRELFALLANSAEGRGYDVMLIDAAGVSLFDSALGGGQAGAPASFPDLAPSPGDDAGGYGLSEDIHGAPTIYGYAPLQAGRAQAQERDGQQFVAAVNQLGWTNVVYREQAALFEPVFEFQRLMAWVTVGAVLAFGLASFAISRTITSPLRSLTAAAQRLSAGELGSSIAIGANRELDQLADSFNRMSDQLQSTLRAMRQEIDERRQAEEAASASERRLRSTLDSMLEGAQIIGPDWRYLYVNQAAAEQGRQTREALLGRTMMEMYPGIEETEMFSKLRRCIEDGESTVMQNEFTFPDGSVGWFELSIQRVPEGVFILSSEVTERKLAEEEIRQLNVELEQRVQRRTAELEAANQELEAFAYSVSHDLRAPLRSIDGFTQALAEDYSDQLDERAKDYAERVRAAAQRMGMLIDDMLTLSRVTRSEMNHKEVDLSAVAQQVVDWLQSNEPDREVETRIERGLVGSGDRNLLQVALENLLGNAWKFTGNTAAPEIEFGLTRSNGRQAYFVRDNGTGFDMRYAGKLFGAFQRLHSVEEFPGTGIGLATVQRIIRRHGGEVWAEAEVGKGATFYFNLPGVAEHADG